MKLTRKSLSKWLWFVTQTAKVEELQYPFPEHEPLSYRRPPVSPKSSNPKAIR